MIGFLRPFADANIANRTLAVLAVAGLAGLSVVVARAVLPLRKGALGAVVLPAARDGYAYLVFALATRFVVQEHRSRWQILVLLGLVTAIEALRLRRGDGALRGATWLAGCTTVCLGVVMAKWALEPGALSDALSDFSRPAEN